MSLKFQGVGIQKRNTRIFPPFTLEIEPGTSVSLHTSTETIQTLLSLFEGTISPSEGRVLIHNEAMTSKSKTKEKGMAVSLTDEGLYTRLTVQDNLQFFQKWYTSTTTVKEVLHLTQLTDISGKKVKHLSFSEHRRLQVARVLLMDPSIIIFQELDQNVDTETKTIFIHLINHLTDTGKSVLLLASNLESAITMSEKVFRLNQHGLASITTEDDTAENDPAAEEEPGEKTEEPMTFDKIPTKVDKKIFLFHPADIDYIESSSGYVYVFVGGEKFEGYFTLTELERRLHPHNFFRCHRSYLVNLNKVSEVITWTRNSYSLKIEDGSDIPLSKTKLIHLKQLMGLA